MQRGNNSNIFAEILAVGVLLFLGAQYYVLAKSPYALNTVDQKWGNLNW